LKTHIIILVTKQSSYYWYFQPLTYAR